MKPAQPTGSDGGNYQVVALKYRPQTFSDLIGQSSIATALSNAINQSRVGHAYLFTGARGVGKTSSARIFAKCLNCENGPTTTPCNECDICQTVSTGEDVDVLEIDGASNRGIDEIRSLRSNASIRPSRSRYKIYIIDEVHMLTMQAFNALLKTLEEPPGHVKFIFCTTDPQKIPITVLSRCQRFDFSPVQTQAIADSLRAIAASEGVQANEQALALLARRANGSMRDSQSLLEQLFSFCDSEITVEHVHQLLGTADIGRIGEIAAAMVNRDGTTTMNLINQASNEGVNAGQLASQLLGYFRDAMAVKVNCGLDTLLTCTSTDMESLTAICERLGLETLLSIVQILDAAVVKMQSSLHARTLVEVAAIRVCNLENLDSISDLVQQLSGGNTTGATVKRPIAPPSRSVELQKVVPTPALKKNEIAEPQTQSPLTATANDQTFAPPASHLKRAEATPNSGPEARRSVITAAAPATTTNATAVINKPTLDAPALKKAWAQMVEALGGITADMAASYESLKFETENTVLATLSDAYHVRQCGESTRKQMLEQSLSEIVGRKLRVEFRASKKVDTLAKPEVPQLSRAQQMRKLQEVEFVKQVMSIFDAEVVGFFDLTKR